MTNKTYQASQYMYVYTHTYSTGTTMSVPSPVKRGIHTQYSYYYLCTFSCEARYTHTVQLLLSLYLLLWSVYRYYYVCTFACEARYTHTVQVLLSLYLLLWSAIYTHSIGTTISVPSPVKRDIHTQYRYYYLCTFSCEAWYLRCSAVGSQSTAI